jgi:DNA-binding protein H-NS
MKIDLDKMSRKELTDLRAQVDRALETLGEREREAALQAADEAARAHGFSLAELGVAGGKGKRKGKASGSKNPPKYRNPDNPSQTWSGLGRRPQWVKDAEAEGTPLEKLAI